MTPLTPWLKDLLPYTPSIVRSVAKRELIKAAREFYRDSTAWQEVTDDYDFSANEWVYDVVPQSRANSEVIQILSVEVGGTALDGKAQRPVGVRGKGTPTAWYPVSSVEFEVWPTPDTNVSNVTVRTILIPTNTATQFPDVAASKHYDALMDGALGRIYAHPAKPYSDPQRAEYHLRRFRSAIATAKGEAIQGGFAGQNWAYPRYGK